MEFLKKHYEKIILSLVLVGLAVAAAWLPIKLSNVRDTLAAATRGIEAAKVKPLPPNDLASNYAVLKRIKTPPPFALAKAGHNVFNPIQWKKKADGTPMPSLDSGLNALAVLKIVPLYTRIEYQGPRPGGDDLRYQFQVVREASTNTAFQRPLLRIATLGSKNDAFILKDLQGTKENPDGLVLEVPEFKTNVVVTKDAPFAQIAGYSADLRYDPESRTYARMHTGSKLTLSGTAYNIVAISPSDVTLEDSQTKKRTTIRSHATQ